MDPVIIAARVTSLLLPYLEKMAGKTAEKIGDQLPATVGTVWKAITGRFKGESATEALTDFASQATDEDNQTAFRKQLKKVVENDPNFLAEIEHLLTIAQQGSSALNRGEADL